MDLRKQSVLISNRTKQHNYNLFEIYILVSLSKILTVRAVYHSLFIKQTSKAVNPNYEARSYTF